MSTFLKLHHGFLDHEKHADISNDALMLHISGLMHSSERLTDGRLPKSPAVVLAWAARLVAAGHDVETLAAELVDAGVWEEWPGYYQIVNYEKYNRTREQVDAVRSADRRRKRAQRERETAPSSDTDTETEVPCDSGAESRRDADRDPKATVTALQRARRGGAA